jgi:hypothetical protein
VTSAGPPVLTVSRAALAGQDLLMKVADGQLLALVIRGVLSSQYCEGVIRSLLAGTVLEPHEDVPGLEVFGLSHFQAARDQTASLRYSSEAASRHDRLRDLCAPLDSPFDRALSILGAIHAGGVEQMCLPTEGLLAPFTIRIYRPGVGIEPHQDLLEAESPLDLVACSLQYQVAVNLYLSIGDEGGALTLFDTSVPRRTYLNLDEGPRTVPETELATVADLQPRPGDMVMFSSRRVHAVRAPAPGELRATLSFFVGLVANDSPAMYWA